MKAQLQLLDFPGDVKYNEPIARHTTFKIGGPCKAMVFVRNKEELENALAIAKENSIKCFIIGKGSNILASDEGFDGIIIKLTGDFLNCKFEDGFIHAGAGVSLNIISKTAMENGFSGFEFLSGIPGSVGGGIRMNAGAYGGEIKDLIYSVTALGNNGKLYIFDNPACEFDYRHSVFSKGEYIILDAIFKCENRSSFNIIKEKTDELSLKRSLKQPLNFPSAGSTFKRPPNAFAAQLIDEAGLKGYSVGDASISEKHAGFVINKGTASSKDIIKLMSDVKKIVFTKTGIMLEPEIIFLGNDDFGVEVL